MKILLQKATLIDPKNAFHYLTKDILITDGIITAIEDEIDEKSAEIINYPNLHVSKGWSDSSVCFGEPGYEERETLENGLKTAGLSGFTQIGVSRALFYFGGFSEFWDFGKLKTKLHKAPQNFLGINSNRIWLRTSVCAGLSLGSLGFTQIGISRVLFYFGVFFEFWDF